MVGITSYINTEEGGRRIKGRVGIRIEVRVKVRVKTKVRAKVDREEKGKTDRLILTSSTTPLKPPLGASNLSKEEANTSTSTTTTTSTKNMTKKKKNKMPKKKMKKRRKTKNHVSSAQKRSNITLEVFVGTRLASEYTIDS